MTKKDKKEMLSLCDKIAEIAKKVYPKTNYLTIVMYPQTGYVSINNELFDHNYNGKDKIDFVRFEDGDIVDM